MEINQICVVGLGYIGLPTATVFALAGKSVLGVDINPEIVASLNQGKPHFAEPELQNGVKQAVENGKFFAKSHPASADVFIIAVPTPLTVKGEPDLQAVFAAAEQLAPMLQNGNLIVLESTSPVGTTEQLAARVQALRPELSDLHFAYCPERVLPGDIMQEIYTNDRIIGGLTPEATEKAMALYRIFAQGDCVPTNARTAELCKLAENSFRDVNIAFANELSMLCDEWGVSVWALIALANRHPRVNILQPGAGVGGHCIAVDPYFIVSQRPQLARLIHTARQVNESKPAWVVEKVKAAVAECAMATERKPSELTIACLGLAFKADVDDLRESPALAITAELAAWHKGEVWAVEPSLAQLPPILQKKVSLVPLDCAVEQADVLVLLVDHAPFKDISAHTLASPYWVDCRGVWAV